MAQLHTAEKAVNEGASFITHLFNAMLPVSAGQIIIILGLLVSSQRSRDCGFVNQSSC